MLSVDDPHLTIPEFFDAAVAAHPERVFVRHGSRDISYAAFQDLTLRAAAAFQQRGIASGDRVALLLGTTVEHVAAWIGLARLGAVTAALNPRLAVPEIQRLLTFLHPSLLVTELPSPEWLRDRQTLDPASLFDAPDRPDPVTVAPHQVAALIATSGSTGAPKAVMQPHRTYVLTGQAFPGWVGLEAEDRLLVVLPLHHINAQAYSVMAAIGAGASLALVPRFSASSFWDDARRTGATHVNVVGAMVEILSRQPERPDDASNPIRRCYTALALPRERHRRFEERFGLEMLVGYGMSETTFGTVWPRSGPRPYDTIGFLRQHPLLPGANVARVIDSRGDEVPAGATGELLLRNPAMMSGYFDGEAETRDVMRDGWLHTGDLVTRSPNGCFRFVARKKEIIRRRGENIAPAEIETILMDHPAVREVAVVGVPSDLGEEAVRAFVVPAPGMVLDVAELRAWCLQHLAPFKVPDEFVFRESLPRTETARIVRRELR